MDIGTVIKERRAVLGISQQDLSDYSGVGISTVKDLERGVGNPSLQTLQKILEFYTEQNKGLTEMTSSGVQLPKSAQKTQKALNKYIEKYMTEMTKLIE